MVMLCLWVGVKITLAFFILGPEPPIEQDHHFNTNLEAQNLDESFRLTFFPSVGVADTACLPRRHVKISSTGLLFCQSSNNHIYREPPGWLR